MASITWGQEIADVYDAVYAATFEPSVIDPMVGVLASLAGDGPVLEFAAGTGRVALALSARGIPVRGSSCRRTWLRGCAPSPARTLCPRERGGAPASGRALRGVGDRARAALRPAR